MSTSYYVNPRDESDEPVACTHYGGVERGPILHVLIPVPVKTEIVSEYGEVLTMWELLRRHMEVPA